MARTTGAKNIANWTQLTSIPTTTSQEIRHLAASSGVTALAEFENALDHQSRYLSWIDTRHEALLAMKGTKYTSKGGPKDQTFRKYRWYADQQQLLEAVNGMEVFYKRSLVRLAEAIQSYVPADKIKGSIDAKVMWSMRGKVSVPALLLEHQLFHSTDQVDQSTHMLIDAKRYMSSNPSAVMRPTLRGLQTAFQVRHTLSHNQGLVTSSDAAKFRLIGCSAQEGQVVDPQKDRMSESLRKV